MVDIDIGCDEKGNRCFIDLENLIETRLLIQANSGGGKSYCIRRLVEQTHGKVQQIIIDLEGEFSTLREKYDFILVGSGGEVSANIKTAELLARKLLELNVSAIIDLSELKKPERIIYVKKFLDSIVDSPKALWHSCIIVVDEAHQFCLSEDTEILTQSGWKKYNEIKIGELAFSFNKDDSIYELKPIKNILIRQHEGELNHLYNEDSIDCLVTDDHRVLCSTRTIDKKRNGVWSNLKFIQSKELPSGFKIPLTSYLDGLEFPIDEKLLQILGWIITDGNKKNGKNISYEITQSKYKRDNIAEKMKKIIKDKFPSSSCYNLKKRGKTKEGYCFYINTEDSKIIKSYLGDNVHRIPRILLEKATRHQLNILFNALIEGDGTIQESKNGYKGICFYAGYNEKLADDFQELCIRIGYSAIKKKVNANNQFVVKVSEKRKFASIRKVKKQFYSGIVWDITIDNGAFVCRRNGKHFITGNCPEGSKSESSSSVIDLMTRGRKRGFCGVLATQRISKLHKDACAEANNKLIGRTGLDIDRKRASDELGFNTKDQERSLRNLAPGEFYAFGPSISTSVIKVKIGDVLTTHISGNRTKIKASETPTNIKKILGKLEDLPKEAETELKTKEDMIKRINELKRELRVVKLSQPKPSIDENAIEKAVEKAREQMVREAEKTYGDKIKHLNVEIQKLRGGISKSCDILQNLVPTSTAPVRLTTGVVEVAKPQPVIFPRPRMPIPNSIPISNSALVIDSTKPLRQGAMKMLGWLAGSHPEPLSKQRLATLSGFSATGGTFNTYISELKKNGWIVGDNSISITEDGLQNTKEIPDIPSGQELIELWSSKFRAGTGKLLRAICDVYPNEISKEELGEITGFAHDGGTFNTYLSELRRNELVVIINNNIKASDELFS